MIVEDAAVEERQAVETATDVPVILVVDDEEANRDLVRRQLRRGYRVLMAESGARAFEILETERIDLVLLDVMMPEMNGYEVCSRVKSSQRDGFVPIILLTALSQQRDRNQGLAAGADDFLIKPVNGHELRLRVRAFLRIRQQEQTIRSQFGDLARLQELKDDLVSLIIHDLRNPLTGMFGYLQLLQRKAQDPVHDALMPTITKILSSTEKLRHILEGVLQVRLLEVGQLPIQRTEVPLAEVIADAVATMEGGGESQEVGFEIKTDGDPIARLDRNLVRRALENLLSNALKYSPKGTSIEVVASKVDDGVQIDVCDRGPGVPDDLKRDLFEKYASVEAKQGGARRGYGLGLYLVRLVMDAHTGRATVRDRKGGGTTFSLVFPQDSGDSDAAQE